MDNDLFKHIASQLRKPEGDMGRQVADKMNIGNEQINKWTIEMLDVQPNDNILEIGMGNGAFVKEIMHLDGSARYSGIDYSDVMIEEATRINKVFVNKNHAHFLLGKAEELPFMVHSFDKIFTVNTLYFWDDAAKVFEAIKRVLKTAGKLIIAVRPKWVMNAYPFTNYGFTMYSKEELIEVLRINGFRVSEVIERAEADQEMNGNFVKTASLIVQAIR